MSKPKLTKTQRKNLERWIHELEHGTHRKMTTLLGNETMTRMCCLGVACKILDSKHVFIRYGCMYHRGSYEDMPESEWMKSALGLEKSEADILAGYNDGEGRPMLSHKKIAGVIRNWMNTGEMKPEKVTR